jgi:hypothetical protein
VRRDLEAHLQALSDDLLRIAHDGRQAAQRELDRAVGEARAEVERSSRARFESMRADLTRDIEARLTAARASAPTAVDPRFAIRQGRVDTLERLLGAVRRIDEATSLTGILDALAKGAGEAAARVAVLLLEGDTLKTWTSHGFQANVLPPELPIGHSGVLSAAVELRQTSFVPPAMDPRNAALPAFLRLPAGHTGLVTPIVVAGDVVAVIYADDARSGGEQEDPRVWTEEVELLVRHAAIRLENVTTERAVAALTRPA